MRLFKFFLTGALFAATSVSAQVTSPSLLMPSSATTVLAADSTPAPDSASVPLSSEPAPAAKPQQPGVIGVFENFNFQGYVGYNFFRFYEAPGNTYSRNGYDSSLAYYFHGGWIAAEGSLMGTVGRQDGYRSRFQFAGGGPRFRFSAPRSLEFYAHGLVGGSHYTPQTAYGNQGAFGYELGGGVDANANHRRIAYRFEMDMLGTRYFSTYQLSPMASVGIVFKF